MQQALYATDSGPVAQRAFGITGLWHNDTYPELIQEVEDNPTKLRKTIANEFGIPSCTLTTIMRDKKKYKKQYFGGEENVGTTYVNPTLSKINNNRGRECLQKKGERSPSGSRGLTFTLVHSSKVD